MSKKIFLLPGFGENASCFRNLRPYLNEYELEDIDYRPILDKINIWETKPTRFVEQIIKYHHIHKGDKLIGHSIGGYFSYVISLLQGNGVCLINSFTHTDKIVRFSNNKVFNHLVTGSGMIKTPLMRYYIQKRNKDERMKTEMLRVHKNFSSFSNEAMLKMSILSFGEDLPISPIPPLLLHAMDDRIVRHPDHSFEKVKGGHFSPVFHPDEVYEKMKIWLES